MTRRLKNLIGAILVIAVLGAVGVGIMAQDVSAHHEDGYVHVLGPLLKVFNNPARGLVKSYDVEWVAEPVGGSDTFESLNDFASDAIDTVDVDSRTLTFGHANGSTTSISLSALSSPTGTASFPIDSVEVARSPGDVAITLSAGGGDHSISLPGAGLTAGVMTADDRTKLDSIAVDAQVNVQPDWNATSGDAQILNKPTVPILDTTGTEGQVLTRTTAGFEWDDPPTVASASSGIARNRAIIHNETAGGVGLVNDAWHVIDIATLPQEELLRTPGKRVTISIRAHNIAAGDYERGRTVSFTTEEFLALGETITATPPVDTSKDMLQIPVSNGASTLALLDSTVIVIAYPSSGGDIALYSPQWRIGINSGEWYRFSVYVDGF